VLQVAFLSSAALELFSALSVALVAVYCGFRLLGLFPVPVPETMDLQRALFCLALAPEFYLPLRRLAAAYHDKQLGEAAAVRAQKQQPVQRPSSQGTLLDHAPALSFHNVCIAYDAGTQVGPFSFVAEPGQITVLVGASGSGKTSLLKALLGLAPVTSGEVRLDGRDLPEGLAASVAWAGQAPVILPASLADNIALADRTASRVQVLAAAQWAGLQPVIDNRPGGLDTRLGERGSGLSGGERRRIALARARLKSSPILLLDEPTSDLDPVAEAEFITLIRQLAEGRTVILATHSEAVAALGRKVVRL
jgi:ATP-binding cassette subfamily C protein CydD